MNNEKLSCHVYIRLKNCQSKIYIGLFYKSEKLYVYHKWQKIFISTCNLQYNKLKITAFVRFSFTMNIKI